MKLSSSSSIGSRTSSFDLFSFLLFSLSSAACNITKLYDLALVSFSGVLVQRGLCNIIDGERGTVSIAHHPPEISYGERRFRQLFGWGQAYVITSMHRTHIDIFRVLIYKSGDHSIDKNIYVQECFLVHSLVAYRRLDMNAACPQVPRRHQTHCADMYRPAIIIRPIPTYICGRHHYSPSLPFPTTQPDTHKPRSPTQTHHTEPPKQENSSSP